MSKFTPLSTKGMTLEEGVLLLQGEIDRLKAELAEANRRLSQLTHCETCGGTWADDGINARCGCHRNGRLREAVEKFLKAHQRVVERFNPDWALSDRRCGCKFCEIFRDALAGKINSAQESCSIPEPVLDCAPCSRCNRFHAAPRDEGCQHPNRYDELLVYVSWLEDTVYGGTFPEGVPNYLMEEKRPKWLQAELAEANEVQESSNIDPEILSKMSPVICGCCGRTLR